MAVPQTLDDFLTPGTRYTAVSLYSGAGGLDLGLRAAGVRTVFANDIDALAVETHNKLFGDGAAIAGDVRSARVRHRLSEHYESGVDLVVGGPPCQGFSVAGKMDPNDPRSRHVFDFLGIVKKVRPRAFVMENVKALAVNKRWSSLLDHLVEASLSMGYGTQVLLLNASHFNVPQARERMFLIGSTEGPPIVPLPTSADNPPTVRTALDSVPPYGTPGNDTFCTAKITLARSPVMRLSPYAGMLFNGQGRPLALDRPALTLPASMGGNRTPIVDQDELGNGAESWVVPYHRRLAAGEGPLLEAPPRLRRLTVEEAAAIQTFPNGMYWAGSITAQFRQIGNAVPPRLAYHLGTALIRSLRSQGINEPPGWADEYQLRSTWLEDDRLPLNQLPLPDIRSGVLGHEGEPAK